MSQSKGDLEQQINELRGFLYTKWMCAHINFKYCGAESERGMCAHINRMKERSVLTKIE